MNVCGAGRSGTEPAGGTFRPALTLRDRRTMMLQTILITAVLLATMPADGFAQGNDARSRGDRACRNDASRLCRKVLDQGDRAVLACLQQNEKKLGRSWRNVLEENGQS